MFFRKEKQSIKDIQKNSWKLFYSHVSGLSAWLCLNPQLAVHQKRSMHGGRAPVHNFGLRWAVVLVVLHVRAFFKTSSANSWGLYLTSILSCIHHESDPFSKTRRFLLIVQIKHIISRIESKEMNSTLSLMNIHRNSEKQGWNKK